MQLVYGDKVVMQYFPILGFRKLMYDDEIQKNDSMYTIKKHAKEQPQVKCIVTNWFDNVTYLFSTPDLAREFAQKHKFYEKVQIQFGETMKDGLLFSERQKWKRQRGVLSNHFNFNMLKSRFQLIKSIVYDTCQQIEKDIPLENSQKYQMNILPYIKNVTTKVIVQTFFSADIDQEEMDFQRDIAVQVEQLLENSFKVVKNSKIYGLKVLLFGHAKASKILQTPNERFYNKSVEELKKRIRDNIDKRIELNKDKSIEDLDKHKDFLNISLEAMEQGLINKDEIVDQFLTFYSTGIDTTMYTFYTIMTMFGKYQHIQDKVREEIKGLFGDKVGEDNFTFEKLNKLDYLQQVIWEALRYCTTAPLLFTRKALQDNEIGEFKVKKGEYVDISHAFMHFNSNLFVNPEEFNPDRWSNENKGNYGTQYIPFSTGQRNCIGQHMAQVEIKIMTILFLQSIKVLEPPKMKPQEFSYKFTYQLKEEDLLVQRVQKEDISQISIS